MPSDDYAPIGGGGALKLKGAKVDKKKKKKKTKTDLVKNISAPESNDEGAAAVKTTSQSPEPVAEGEDKEEFVPQKTEAEKRHDEVKRKRVRVPGSLGSRHRSILTLRVVIEDGGSIWVETGAAEDA